MPRPPLPIGTWGTVTRTEISAGRWRARAKYRDYDGRTRTVERYGPTGAAAERALKEALRDRAKPTDSLVDITRDTTLTDLAELWIDKRDSEGLITATTLAGYQRLIDRHINPALGGVRVSEATVGRLDRFIRAIPGATTAKQCRIVLAGMMQLAAQHDAIDHNRVADTTRRRANRAPARALTVAELARLRARVEAWSGGNTTGPKRGYDLLELFDVFAGTGARIGEVLALQWQDVTWTGEQRGTITVAGTIVDGATRQPFGKTHSSHRTITLPAFTEAALLRQRERDLPTEADLVFPSRTGSPRSTNNTRRQLREARAWVGSEPDGDPVEFEWVTPHTFRRTAATMIERAVDAEAAAGVLGHASPDVTRAHYIERALIAPDVSAVFDVLAPVSGGFRVGDTEKAPPG